MKKHILSKYSEKKEISLLFSNKTKDKERGAIENSNTYYLASKKTVKTFSVENTDSDEIMNFSCTDAKTDSTETVEVSDFGEYDKAIFFSDNTKLLRKFDSDEVYLPKNRKKTVITETVENSDKDEFI